MSNFILIFYCCEISPQIYWHRTAKLLLFSPLVLGIGWAQLNDSSCDFSRKAADAGVISKACSLQVWLLMLAVNWDLSGSSCQEHLHVTSPYSLGFLTTQWLGSKGHVPREKQTKLYYILWPSNRSHIGLPRFKGRGHTLHLCMGVRQGSRRACREETIVLAICTKYYLPQEINPQWSIPLWPCSLWQVSSSPSLITHDQADLSFQWPSFRGEEWTVGKQILRSPPCQKYCPESILEALEIPLQSLFLL